MVPDNPLTCAEKLAAAHESATLLQASWKVADIVDGALEGAVASTLEDASRHPVAEAAAAELLGASAARHGVEARPWVLRPPHAAKHERNAVLRAVGCRRMTVTHPPLGGPPCTHGGASSLGWAKGPPFFRVLSVDLRNNDRTLNLD